MPDYAERARRIAQIPGVTRAAPLVRGQVMAIGGMFVLMCFLLAGMLCLWRLLQYLKRVD